MFDLKEASAGIRKFAAMKGIRSGKIDLIYNDDDPQHIATIYNKNNPDGFVVYTFDAENALTWTWKDINRKVHKIIMRG